MGNCLAACYNRGPVEEGGEDVRLGGLSTSHSSPLPAATHLKVEEIYLAVQKELEDLQNHISKSQALLSSVRYVELDGKKRLVEVSSRETQTALDTCSGSGEEVRGRSKTDVSNLTNSCPAIVSTSTASVQTDLCNLVLRSKGHSDAEYFIPPIPSPELDEDGGGDMLGQLLESPHLDLDIHRSCRKLSVLPEEQVYDLGSGGWMIVRQMSDPGSGGGGGPGVRRQASDPSPRSTSRPLQLPSRGDSAISSAGSSTSSPLPPPPPASPPPHPATPPSLPSPPPSSSDTSLSFFTPDDLPTDPTLSPPSLLSPPPAILRIPSRRRLVRSLATDNASDSDSPLKQNWDFSDLLDEMEVEVPVENQLCVPSVELPNDNEDVETFRSDGFSRSIDSERTCATTERTLATLLEHPHQMQELPQSPEEIESLATSLAIAFKTDKLTLLKRLEIQTRLRDQSEINVANEIVALKAFAQQVRPPNEDGEKCELVKKLEEQIENLHRSARYVSSAAEGAKWMFDPKVKPRGSYLIPKAKD